MRKGTVSLPDCPNKMVILTLSLKMKGDEQVFAGQTVAVSVLKNKICRFDYISKTNPDSTA
jgi:hypothetical protein